MAISKQMNNDNLEIDICVSKDNKIIVTETNEDANKKSNDRKPNEMTPTTLANHLTVIFKCSKTEWWAEQDKSIRDKVKKYQ